MPGERKPGPPARVGQQANAFAYREQVPPAWSAADTPDATPAFGRAICQALTLYWELRRTRTTPTTATRPHPGQRHDWRALPQQTTELATGTSRLRCVGGTTAPVSLPPYVRRAITAIHADPAHPYTVIRLAELAGVKVRTLQQGFRSRLGTSPMSYLRSVRLARAHDDLIGGEAPGVAEVAYRWGFTHLGRFASVYAAQYGEVPSHTRNRRPPG